MGRSSPLEDECRLTPKSEDAETHQSKNMYANTTRTTAECTMQRSNFAFSSSEIGLKAGDGRSYSVATRSKPWLFKSARIASVTQNPATARDPKWNSTQRQTDTSGWVGFRGSCLRKFMLAFHTIVNLGFTAVLVLMVIFAPIEKTLEEWGLPVVA
ncbi:unnamed protein product [Notodromas monacha]|uniref:Uncharacterized protein n=1 Tax=Notodromas monacha TaxID=399045 RepID=A0A7R9GA76_9CRUS|nr:unnamed protein product [Notodromas monacha]CAG0913714.1 unnamed protein product [Notodromas monacha]